MTDGVVQMSSSYCGTPRVGILEPELVHGEGKAEDNEAAEEGVTTEVVVLFDRGFGVAMLEMHFCTHGLSEVFCDPAFDFADCGVEDGGDWNIEVFCEVDVVL